MEPLFFSFEGIDGSGKTTQQGLFVEYLRNQGHEVVATADPGGTNLGAALREMLLYGHFDLAPRTEALLFAAQRSEHVAKVIYPAITAGKKVVSDRYSDSMMAYQGYGRGFPLAQISALSNMMGLWPNTTFFIDTPVPESMARLAMRKRVPDNFEKESRMFAEKVREGFLKIADGNPRRVRIVSGAGTEEEVHQRVVKEYHAIHG